MGSTVFINQTTKPLDVQIGNYRYFTKVATVDKNGSYTVHVDYNDTYLEYSMGTDATGKPLIVNSDECADNKTIIIKEVNGKFNVEREPRVMSRSSTSALTSTTSEPVQSNSSKKTSKWKFCF